MTAGSPPVRAAALIRASIRAAVEAGTLGVLPDWISFSVRGHDFATGPGVTITLYGAPDGWRATSACEALAGKLREIAALHWQPPAPDGFTYVDVLGRPDDLDIIAAETAQITDEHIEERLRETLARAGMARGDIPGHPKKKRRG
jgi:hypothetical protein